jgi:hypothetical protein
MQGRPTALPRLQLPPLWHTCRQDPLPPLDFNRHHSGVHASKAPSPLASWPSHGTLQARPTAPLPTSIATTLAYMQARPTGPPTSWPSHGKMQARPTAPPTSIATTLAYMQARPTGPPTSWPSHGVRKMAPQRTARAQRPFPRPKTPGHRPSAHTIAWQRHRVTNLACGTRVAERQPYRALPRPKSHPPKTGLLHSHLQWPLTVANTPAGYCI